MIFVSSSLVVLGWMFLLWGIYTNIRRRGSFYLGFNTLAIVCFTLCGALLGNIFLIGFGFGILFFVLLLSYFGFPLFPPRDRNS